jgi:uncharacterized protein
MAYGRGGEDWIERYGHWVIRRRGLVLGAAVLAAAVAGAGLPGLGLSTDYRMFFSADNPDLRAYETIESVYTRNDPVLFVVRPVDGDVFTAQALDAVRELVEQAWQVPYSTRVDAITNFQHTRADGDELVVEDLVPAGAITPAVTARARAVALAEPLLRGRLVAEDGSAAGVAVRIELPGESTSELPAAIDAVRGLEREFAARYPELEIRTTGVAMLNMAFAEAPMRDGPVLIPFMLLALLVALVGMLRSRGATLATLAVIGLSTVTAMGVAGHLGVLLDPASAAAPVIILTLAVADSVHVLVSYRQLAAGRSPRAAVVEALRLNAQPVLLTSATTAIGFLTLNFSDAPPFRLLGNLTAFGVLLAWVYSMTALPAMMSFLHRSPRPAKPSPLRRWVTAVGGLVVRHPRTVLAGTGAAVIALALATTTLRVNDDYFEYFDERMPIRRGTDFALEHLTGVYQATFSLESGEAQGVSDPAYLAAVDAFVAWLEARPAVRNVSSFTHVLKRLNRNMHADDPAEHRLPASHDLAAQYLLLYELSLPYGLDLNDQIDVERSSLRIDVTYGDVDVSVLRHEADAAAAWLARHGTVSMRNASATGPGLMFANITRRNIASMMRGTALGFVLISLCLMVALRSLRLGIISLVPNIVPALMAFGVWALTVGEVGFAVSIVAGLAIGIIVDDTVHFLAKYNRVRGRMAAPAAVLHAFEGVGVALVANTAIVAVGFAVLGLSAFKVTAYMGLLTALTVVCALVVDFLLLPALLIVFDRRPVTAEARQPAPSAAVAVPASAQAPAA